MGIVQRIVAVFGCLAVLGGCADHLAELRELKPVAGDFQSALASEYLGYAESEAEQGHANSAQHFAGKGVAAAKGEAVAPDMPGDNQDMVAAREALLMVLTEDVKRVNAQAAARAQLLYDCWLSQAGTAAQGELIPCADEFRSSLDEVQQVADLLVHGEEAKHTLKFAGGSSELTGRDVMKLRKIARHVKTMANYAIELEAHEAGADPGMDALMAARVQTVREALVARGVGAHRIKEKSSESGKAVLLSSDVEATNVVEVTVRTYTVPGGR